MSSNGNIFCMTGHLCGEFTGPVNSSPHKCQWHGALMFSLICAWINGWGNNDEAGYLRCHQTHLHVDVMIFLFGVGVGDKTLELELVVQHKDIVSNNADHPLIIPSGVPLQWRHNECDGISNHQHHECLLNPLFRHRSKKISKLHVTGLCEGNSLVTCEFPAQRASKAEKVSILWCHHCSQLLKG